MRQASDTDVPDTTSGFRAYNREAALQMAVVSKFTYTLETIIQAGKLLVATDHVPIAHEPARRASRGCSRPCGPTCAATRVSIFRIYAQYEPLRVFLTAGARALRLVALVRWARFASPTSSGNGAGHVQSLILGAVLFNAAVVLAALGIIGDLLSPSGSWPSGSSSASGASSCSSASSRRTTSPARRADGPAADHGRRGRPDDRQSARPSRL